MVAQFMRNHFKGNYRHYHSLSAGHVPRQSGKYKQPIFWNVLPCLSQQHALRETPGLQSQLAKLAAVLVLKVFGQ